jgi:pimeloyl-ACP methyl ester carboxylesterase
MKTLFIICLTLLCYQSVAQHQKKETILLVHGAWGGSWAFKKLDSTLTSRGYQVYRPSLTGQGERVHLATAQVNLHTHVLDVVNTILYEDLKDVILVGHSYGGMVITGVADSIPNRIKKLIYLDAFAPNDGESLTTARTDQKSGPELNARNGFTYPSWVKEDQLPPKDVPQSINTFTQPVSFKNTQALKIPATYILTVDPGAKKEDDFFYYFAQRTAKRGWKQRILSADHNPQFRLDKTLELADHLQEEAK